MKKFSRCILILLLITVISGAAAYFYEDSHLTAVYNSTAQLYIVPGEENETAVRAADGGLKDDFVIVFKSEAIISEAQKLAGTKEDISKYLTITSPANSNIVEITCTNPDMNTAKSYVDAVANSAQKAVSIIPVDSIQILSEGTTSDTAIKPDLIRNTLYIVAIADGICFVLELIVLLLISAFKPAVDNSDNEYEYDRHFGNVQETVNESNFFEDNQFKNIVGNNQEEMEKGKKRYIDLSELLDEEEQEAYEEEDIDTAATKKIDTYKISELGSDGQEHRAESHIFRNEPQNDSISDAEEISDENDDTADKDEEFVDEIIEEDVIVEENLDDSTEEYAALNEEDYEPDDSLERIDSVSYVQPEEIQELNRVLEEVAAAGENLEDEYKAAEQADNEVVSENSKIVIETQQDIIKDTVHNIMYDEAMATDALESKEIEDVSDEASEDVTAAASGEEGNIEECGRENIEESDRENSEENSGENIEEGDREDIEECGRENSGENIEEGDRENSEENSGKNIEESDRENSEESSMGNNEEGSEENEKQRKDVEDNVLEIKVYDRVQILGVIKK